MGYKSLRECVLDLERHRQLVRVTEEVDPYLEMAEIHRRVFQARGPAIFFENVKGCRFPAVSNLFGTIERGRLLFRDTLERVTKIVQLKADPSRWKGPGERDWTRGRPSRPCRRSRTGPTMVALS